MHNHPCNMIFILCNDHQLPLNGSDALVWGCGYFTVPYY